MSIQSVNSTTSNPYLSTLSNDFKTLQNDVQAFENSQSSGSSGSPDQVTLSQQALNQAMTQVQNDIASLSQQTQGAQGHHHHHGMDAANSSGSTAPSSTTSSSTTQDFSSLLSNSYGSQSQNNVSTINLTA